MLGGLLEAETKAGLERLQMKVVAAEVAEQPGQLMTGLMEVAGALARELWDLEVEPPVEAGHGEVPT